MQTSEEISAHIEETKLKLGSNVHELETKVRSAFDWKQHYSDTPAAVLGVAFGVGVLFAAVFRPRTVTRYVTTSGAPVRSSVASSLLTDPQIAQTWNQVKGALLGAAAGKVAGLIGQALPSFNDHYTGPGKRSV